MVDTNKSFLENYIDLKNSYALSGTSRLKKNFPFLPLKKIEHELGRNEAYSLHKPSKKPVYNPSFINKRRKHLQLDLLDISSHKEYNDGVTFLLCLIDGFSKYAIVRKLFNKSQNHVADTMKSILDNELVPPYPETICHDRGAEFGTPCRLLFKQYNIKTIFPSKKPIFVERFNRTLQALIYKFMAQFETHRYIDNLQQLVSIYNRREHRMIKMAPILADIPSNRRVVFNNLSLYFSKLEQRKNKPKYQVDQLVRFKLAKRTFQRGYDPVYKDQVYRIKKILTHMPRVMYILTDYYKTKEIKGLFYNEELTAYNSDVFKIEKVLKTRMYRKRKQHFVKWVGYDSSMNSWVDSKDMVPI